MVAEEFVKFQTNKFKNKVLSTVYGKYIMEMNGWCQGLLATSTAILGISGLAIGVEYLSELGWSIAVKTGLRYAAVGSGVAIFLFFMIDFGVKNWKAAKNKESF
jgi:hypothetical protein